MNTYQTYLEEVQQLLQKAAQQNAESIPQAVDLIASAIENGRVLYTFGASHAGLLAQDLFYRAGGLMAVEPLMPAGLMVNVRPITCTSRLEQLPGYADVVLNDHPLGEGDVLLLISVSGRNPVITEMCSLAQARGAKVIGLTSLTYSRTVTPRHGKQRLFEAADVVLDLPGYIGDAALKIDGLETPIAPTSTAVGSAILQGLIAQVTTELLRRGSQPPVLLSGNLDNSKEKNQILFDKYRGLVSYL